MIFFTKPYQVIRATGTGSYVEGVWTPAPEATSPATVLLNLQPASGNDVERVAAMAGGQALSEVLVAFAEPGALTPGGRGNGDVVVVGGDRFLVMGGGLRDTLGPDTRHARYLLVQEIPQAPGEA